MIEQFICIYTYTRIFTCILIYLQMVTCRSNGRIYIHNIVTTDVLCEVVLPVPYEILDPWQPVTAVGGQGQMLYIRGRNDIFQKCEFDLKCHIHRKVIILIMMPMYYMGNGMRRHRKPLSTSQSTHYGWDFPVLGWPHHGSGRMLSTSGYRSYGLRWPT